MNKEERIDHLEAEVFLLKKQVEELIVWVTLLVKHERQHGHFEPPIHTRVVGPGTQAIHQKKERE